MIYFDHAATTNIEPEVYDFLVRSLKDDFANPSSPHKLGRNLQEQLVHSKKEILKLLGASSKDQFYFTSSATESNNTVIKGINLQKDDVVIFSEADHKSVVEPILKLKNLGVQLIPLKHNNDGAIDFSELPNNTNVKLVVLSEVNNQSGNIINLATISKLIKDRYPNAHLHIDMVQSFTKINTKINQYVDSASFSAHKFGGPKGIGGLYLKEKHKVISLINGGGQQNDFRSGTEAYSLEQAFYLAMKIRLKTIDQDYFYVAELSKKLKFGIKEIIPSAIFPFQETSPYILCFIIPKISSDIMLRHLEQKEVYLSSTSACSSKIKGFNSTLMALGIEENFHKNVLRLSLSKYSSENEINEFLSSLTQIWSDLKYLLK